MEPTLITTEAQYQDAVTEIERLAVLDPSPETEEGKRLSLLAFLVETYEKKRFKFEKPDPVEAILFRMEEQGLRQVDLIPYIGSKSKVSEVLARKRSLTLSMIRALHTGLGIPSDILLQDQKLETTEPEAQETRSTQTGIPSCHDFPMKEMIKRGWITLASPKAKTPKSEASELIHEFLRPLGGAVPQALWKRGKADANPRLEASLFAWAARVKMRAQDIQFSEPYDSSVVTDEFLKAVVRLSWSEQGPVLAQEFLSKHGIPLIIEPHLSKTRLDGGALLLDDGRPVVALTLRYDRLDHFWFVLLHELVHVQRHLKNKGDAFLDNLEEECGNDFKEREADLISREAMIPRSKWNRSDAFRQRTPAAVLQLAKELRIHPAVVAGRIRFDAKDYTLLGDLVGNGKLKMHFPETSQVSSKGEHD